ncbi:MAG TPA: hypothetical protein DEH11_21795 [Actinobacteria bacterium]|nr:hypothetical protein [Actinomycetota bacterium]
MRWWKVLGLAGFASVAATGVIVVRSERKRRAYTPAEIRERLHARLADASAVPSPAERDGVSSRHRPRRRAALTRWRSLGRSR